MKALIYVNYGKYKGEIANGYKEKAKSSTITINNEATCWIITEGERNYIYITGDKWEWLGEYKDNSIKELIKAIINGCNLQDVTEGEIAIRHYVYKNKGYIYAKFRKDNQKITFEERPREMRDSPDYNYMRVRSKVLKFFEPIYHLPEKIGTIGDIKESDISKHKDKIWICVISNDFAVGREGWKAKAENDYLLFAVSEHQDVISTLRNWKNKYNPKSLYLAVHEPFFQTHKENIEKISSLHISFHHIPSTDPVYEAIRSGGVQKIINLIFKKILTILLHRIAHLFLPMDIDLMGICEVLKERRNSDAETYFNEAFSDCNYNPGGKIEKLLKRITDEKREDNIFKEEKLKDLPDEFKNKVKEIIRQKFKIKRNNKEKEIEIKDIISQLNKKEFKDLEGTLQNWAKNPEQNPFHQWFCEVMQKLEKMKEELLTKGSVQGNANKKGIVNYGYEVCWRN